MSESTRAANLEARISTIRERLTDLLTDWGADFSMFLKELEEKRARLQVVEAEAASRSHELETARAELDARKSLIESLQGDAERTQALEAQLKEKRDVISKLEEYIERHVSTLAELQQSVANLKEKSASPISPDPSSDATTVSALPQLAEEELQAPESAEEVSGELADETDAVDMRPSLSEAQRTAKTKVTTNR